jgi:phospholipid transport system substrate-binding protein
MRVHSALRRGVCGICGAALLMLPAIVKAGVPLDTVKGHVNSVIEAMKDPSLKGEAGKKAKRERVRAAGDKMFDFVELSKRTLGQNWNKLNGDQRKEFVELYRTILEDAYAEKIVAYTDEKINFTKETPLTEKTVEVQSTVVTKTAEIPIYYRMIKKETGEWRVYDVVIEGVSLINNYRTQFREIMANNQPDYLLDTLRKKTGKK